MLELNKNNIENEIKEDYVLVDFWASWCGPCKAIAPIFEELEKEFRGRVKFAKVDVESEQELAKKYNISGVPALVMFKSGVEVGRIVGALSKDRFIERIEMMLKEN